MSAQWLTSCLQWAAGEKCAISLSRPLVPPDCYAADLRGTSREQLVLQACRVLLSPCPPPTPGQHVRNVVSGGSPMHQRVLVLRGADSRAPNQREPPSSVGRTAGGVTRMRRRTVSRAAQALVRARLPHVHAALARHELDLALVTRGWLLSLFADGGFPVHTTLRIWDCLFCPGGGGGGAGGGAGGGHGGHGDGAAGGGGGVVARAGGALAGAGGALVGAGGALVGATTGLATGSLFCPGAPAGAGAASAAGGALSGAERRASAMAQRRPSVMTQKRARASSAAAEADTARQLTEVCRHDTHPHTHTLVRNLVSFTTQRNGRRF